MVGRRCVFLDRDGVINVKPPTGQYVCRWEDFQIIPQVIDWIRLFQTLDYLVVVVTNQRGVARGLVQAAELERIHHNMLRQLAARGACIDDVFVCPHEAGTCDCRKPLPGLVHQAQQKWDIDLSESILIGDAESDRQLARHCGLRFVCVRDGRIVFADTPDDDVVSSPANTGCMLS